MGQAMETIHGERILQLIPSRREGYGLPRAFYHDDALQVLLRVRSLSPRKGATPPRHHKL